jgi:hypothetical protein
LPTRPASSAAIIQDVKIGNWLNEKTNIQVPEVQAVHPEGKWKITELVGGESLGEYLAARNGVMEPHIEKQIKQVVDDTLALANKTNIKLDLSVDNIKIWNGKTYLIDAGPIPPDVKLPASYAEYTVKWGKNAKVKIPLRDKCSNVLRSFILKMNPQ